MKINEHNYHAWFLDYHEGRLSADQQEDLQSFLVRHPELQQELDDYVSNNFSPDPDVIMPDAGSLKKSLMDYSPLEGRMIAMVEDDLAEEDEKRLMEEISSSEENKLLLEQFRKAKLTPDKSIIFAGASSLKKPVAKLLWSTQRITAAAALILILIGISSLLIFSPWNQSTRETLVLQNISAKGPDPIQLAPDNPPMISERLTSTEKPTNNSREQQTIARINPLAINRVEDQRFTGYKSPMLFTRVPQPAPEYFASADELLAEEKDNSSLAGRVITGFFNKLSAPFNNNRENPASKDRKITFWDFAELGVRSINVLGDHDYTLIREYNDKGNVKGVMLLEE